MTREEAIEKLELMRQKVDEETYRALILAIKALEQEPCDKCKYFDGNSCQHYDYKVGYTQGYEDANNRFGQEPCEDAISREDAIGAIYKANDDGFLFDRVLNKIKALPSVTQKSETVTEFADRCRECGARYGKLLKQKWIPVSEKLPENSGNYLITYCLRDKIETQEAVYVEDEDKWYDITDIEITLAVVAWMPLPEPYKVEPQESEK